VGEWEELTICDVQERGELITGKVNPCYDMYFEDMRLET